MHTLNCVIALIDFVKLFTAQKVKAQLFLSNALALNLMMFHDCTSCLLGPNQHIFITKRTDSFSFMPSEIYSLETTLMLIRITKLREQDPHTNICIFS